MPFLKAFRDGKLLPTHPNRPPSVEATILLIEEIFDRALAYCASQKGTRFGVPDFDEHLRSLKVTLEDQAREMKIRPFTEKIQKGHIAQPEGQDFLSEAIRELADPKFKPGSDLIQLFLRLSTLWLFWSLYPYSLGFFEANDPKSKGASLDEVLKGIPPSAPGFERYLDLSLAKIALQVGIQTANIGYWGKRERTRTTKSTKRRKEKAEARKSYVLAIYEHGETIPEGERFSEVVRIIQDQFEKSKADKEARWGEIPDDMNLPSRKAIEKWFREEGILNRDFEKKGRYWFKRT